MPERGRGKVFRYVRGVGLHGGRSSMSGTRGAIILAAGTKAVT